MATCSSPALSSTGGNGPRPRVGVVTVTYNSDRFFDAYMQSLASQTMKPDLIVLVDSGSSETSFLDRVTRYPLQVEVVRESNVGVCVGNNLGWRRVRDFEYVLFLNPDAFLAPDFLAKAIEYLEAEPSVGMVTPTLVRYDVEQHSWLDRLDTTGVVRSRFGLIRERDQGAPLSALTRYPGPNEIPWLCTAVALGRRESMEAVVEPGDQLFDESFFMYKDDTDLSWRVRRAGWKIVHHPELRGAHCRGWQNRGKISRKARLLSARNEIKMCWKNRSPFVLIGLLKYTAVRFLNL